MFLITLLILMLVQSTDPPPSAAPNTAPNTAPNADPAPMRVSGTNAMGGRVFRIAPGLAFGSIASQLKPGDEVILERGVHSAFTLTDLRGERDKPIVIRGEIGEEPARYPYIKAGDFGVRLVRPRYVVVRDLMIGNGTGPLMLIEGNTNAAPDAPPFEANVRLSGLRLMQTMAAPQQSGLMLRGVSRVDIINISVRGWNQAAALFEGCSQCSLQQAVLDPAKNLPQMYGVQISQGCSNIALSLLTFGPRVGTAFRIGSCEGVSPSTASSSEILISRCSVPNAKQFASIGAAEKVLVQLNTVTDFTRCAWSHDDACGPATQIAFANNIFTWMPGNIDRLCEVSKSLPPESVQMQSNIWFSAEVPAAFEVIGKPFGIEIAPQIFDVDPRIEPQNAAPMDARAQNFGWRAGLDAKAKPTGDAAATVDPAAAATGVAAHSTPATTASPNAPTPPKK